MTRVIYPAKAAMALGFLKSHSNDIDVFVEDTAAPSMWLKLLRRFVPPGLRLKSVTPLGGRNEVIRACRADQGAGGRRRLYIIDADMDLLLGKAKPRLRYLYRTRRYCVENYLISKSALTEVFMNLNPNMALHAVQIEADINSWIALNRENLKSIFMAYAVAEDLELGVPTVSYSCHRLFVDSSDFHICRTKTRRRVFSIYRQAVRNFGLDRVRSSYEMVSRNANDRSVEEYCSAKSYIFPAIYERSKRRIGHSVSFESFKTMLCEHVDVSVDPYFRRRLASL